MKTRRTQVEDDGRTSVLVQDLRTKEWVCIPPEIGCIVLGFPCTPWSLTLGAAFNLLMQHSTHGTEMSAYYNHFLLISAFQSWQPRYMTQFVICSKERCWQGVSRSKLGSCWNRHRDHKARAPTDLADGMCLLASEVKHWQLVSSMFHIPALRLRGWQSGRPIPNPKVQKMTLKIRKTWHTSINSFRLSWGVNTSSQSSGTCLQSRFNFPCADHAGMLLGFAGRQRWTLLGGCRTPIRRCWTPRL